MELRVEIKISAQEKRQLAGILGCSLQGLSDALAPYCAAAAEEYMRMFLGQKVYTRGSDMREYRLFLLIQHAFGNRIPDEQRISDLFQTTATQSRSLIRSVMSKYQYELSSAIETTLKTTVTAATQPEDSDEYLVVVNNENLVEAINRVLASIDGNLPHMAKKRGTVSTYVLMPSSRAALVQHFNLKVD